MAKRRKSLTETLSRVNGDGPRGCDMAGCRAAGEYPAPRARDQLREYYWFCLDHVREYNRAWNFYAGLTPEEVERLNREDMVGQRPTWPLGQRMAGFRGRFYWHDPLDVGDEPRARNGRKHRESEWPLSAEQQAMRVLDVAYPLTPAELKRRYKELVKRYHPDANGGDKVAENKLKEINQAYAVLRASFRSQPHSTAN
jgi:DnaJ-domain-containing protein 1